MQRVHRIKKGLDLPISGRPEQVVRDAKAPSRVAVVAADYPGLRPGMEVKVGDQVCRGQRLFHDKKSSELVYTSPAGGRVVAINRGERRVLLSVVIEVEPNECEGGGGNYAFDCFTGEEPDELEPGTIRGLLLESGCWTAFRTRPYAQVPAPGSTPTAVFVTAMDTHPLAPSVDVALAGREQDFEAGLRIVARLTEGPTYLCTGADSKLRAPAGSAVRHERFQGPHPAGTAGVHIHFLEPVHREKIVWYIGYQDVAAIGALFRTGHLDVSRVVALAGPGVTRPRLLRTRLGASLPELAAGELEAGEQRLISGSVLGGRTATNGAESFLGRYHNQISVLPEGNQRELFGWLKPGGNIFSITNAFTSAFNRKRTFAFTTSSRGSKRPMVPIGTYEQVMPMDMEPTFLLRSLIVGDLEQAELLGCLELEEEDLALCTFVCPGKYEYGPLLRTLLDRMQKEA